MIMNIKLDNIRPAAWNPRRKADDAKIMELADSIEAHGVIQPIVVRELAKASDVDGPTGEFQIVAGSRRHAAAVIAGLDEIPCVVNNVSDEVAAEMAMAENLQNENMSPTDEALGFKHLLENASIHEIACKLGINVSLIRRRLRLLNLHAKCVEALESGRITLSHADILVRLTPVDQAAALHVCFTSNIFDDIEEPAPVGELAKWVGKNVQVEPEKEVIEDYFPSLLEESEVEIEAVPDLLRLSESLKPGADLGIKDHKLVGKKSWAEIGDKDVYGKVIPDCKNAVDGVVVHGGPMRLVRVCAKKGCEVHRPAAKDVATNAAGDEATGAAERKKAEQDWRVEQAQSGEKARQWELERPKVFKAFIAHCEKKGLKLDMEFVRKVIDLKDVEAYFTEAFGEDYELTTDNVALVLAAAKIGWWNRDRARDNLREFGFKMPRVPAAAAKAIKAAGEAAMVEKKGGQKKGKAKSKAKPKDDFPPADAD